MVDAERHKFLLFEYIVAYYGTFSGLVQLCHIRYSGAENKILRPPLFTVKEKV